MGDVDPQKPRQWESDLLHPLVAEAVALARVMGLEPDASFVGAERDLSTGSVSPVDLVDELRLRVADAKAIADLNFAEEFMREGRGWAGADVDGNLVFYGPDGQRLLESESSKDRPAPELLDGRADGEGGPS